MDCLDCVFYKPNFFYHSFESYKYEHCFCQLKERISKCHNKRDNNSFDSLSSPDYEQESLFGNLFSMKTRKVTISVFKYPEDYNRSLSLKRLSQISEELLFKDIINSSKNLSDIISIYEDKVSVFASFDDVIYFYRIVARDSDARISKTFKA